MRSTAPRSMFASLATFTLAAALAPAASFATPPPVQLSKWLGATPDRALVPCAAAVPGTASAPYFDFNGGHYDACLVDGPYPWDGKSWYTLRMTGFVPGNGGAKSDLVRICSLQAAHTTTAHYDGPCRTAKGVGPKGCEVCAANGVPL